MSGRNQHFSTQDIMEMSANTNALAEPSMEKNRELNEDISRVYTGHSAYDNDITASEDGFY